MLKNHIIVVFYCDVIMTSLMSSYQILYKHTSLIRLTWNGLLITSQSSPLTWYLSENYILTKQINDSIYVQYAENRLLEVEKYKSELSVDIKQYEQQIANLQNEYKSEKDKVKKISSHRTTYISGYCYVNSFVGT
jgi:peptidoglycan hydrolase CwlO-like protein